jgi:hypothetical protein
MRVARFDKKRSQGAQMLDGLSASDSAAVTAVRRSSPPLRWDPAMRLRHAGCAMNVTWIGWEERWQALQVADFMMR